MFYGLILDIGNSMTSFIKKWSIRLGVSLVMLFLLFVLLVMAIPNPPEPEKFTYGITFSKQFVEKLEMDWQEVYLAILGELGIKTIRLSAYWHEVEPEEGKFDFSDLDWQVAEAKKRNIGVMMAMGQKLPRWPECHYPNWLGKESDEEKRIPLNAPERLKLLNYIRTVIGHYKNENAISHWQIENEPFLHFGICPELDVTFFDKEVALVRELDTSRPLVISESGEFSTWFGAAKRADILGSTLYRVVWWKNTGYVRYPIPDWFYWKKTTLIKWLYPSLKDIIIIELQGEPWAHLQIYENTIEEMMQSMHPEQFKENLRYARATRFGTQYVWGAEWWYWMKEKQGNDFYWEYAKKVFADE